MREIVTYSQHYHFIYCNTHLVTGTTTGNIVPMHPSIATSDSLMIDLNSNVISLLELHSTLY